MPRGCIPGARLPQAGAVEWRSWSGSRSGLGDCCVRRGGRGLLGNRRRRYGTFAITASGGGFLHGDNLRGGTEEVVLLELDIVEVGLPHGGAQRGAFIAYRRGNSGRCIEQRARNRNTFRRAGIGEAPNTHRGIFDQHVRFAERIGGFEVCLHT